MLSSPVWALATIGTTDFCGLLLVIVIILLTGVIKLGLACTLSGFSFIAVFAPSRRSIFLFVIKVCPIIDQVAQTGAHLGRRRARSDASVPGWLEAATSLGFLDGAKQLRGRGIDVVGGVGVGERRKTGKMPLGRNSRLMMVGGHWSQRAQRGAPIFCQAHGVHGPVSCCGCWPYRLSPCTVQQQLGTVCFTVKWQSTFRNGNSEAPVGFIQDAISWSYNILNVSLSSC